MGSSRSVLADDKCNISINYKTGKIQVYKKAIDAIGQPRFVQFLIDPDTKKLYMRGTDRRENNCLVIPPESARKKNGYVLHGKYFIRKFSALAGWSLDRPHILVGVIMPSQNAVVFDLAKAVAVEKEN